MLLLKLTRFCIFFLLCCPCATPLTFNFTTFSPEFYNTLINIEGDANLGNPFLHLTKDTVGETQIGSVGRATYSQPFLLGETTTGQLAEFTANFTFIIYSQHNATYTDGLAFFLAPSMTFLNSSIATGCSLGLPVNGTRQNITVPKSQYPFVAVEFDSHSNLYLPVVDPHFNHVGINVNSIKSNAIERWNGSIEDGRTNSVWISYNSSTKNLTVDFTSYANDIQVLRHSIWFILWKLRENGEVDKDFMVNDSMDEELQKGIGPRKFAYKGRGRIWWGLEAL